LGTGIVEKTGTIDKGTGILSYGIVTTERVDGVGKSIDGISVIERLGTKNSVKRLATLKSRAVINILIRLDNPDELLDGMIEVKLDLVTGRTDRFITSELKLLNEVLVGVLSHSASLVGVKEDIIDIEGSSYKRLVVGSCDLT
jgi:hypothetical protein